MNYSVKKLAQALIDCLELNNDDDTLHVVLSNMSITVDEHGKGLIVSFRLSNSELDRMTTHIINQLGTYYE